MRKLYILIYVLFVATSVAAQERQFLPVDWEQIRKEVEDHPQRVKDLVARLSAAHPDTTLTPQDRILAFYGQSFLTNDEEDAMQTDMYDAQRQGLLAECLATARKMLAVNPLNLSALHTAGNVIYAMAKDSANHGGVALYDAKLYWLRARRIYKTIAMTGDGSGEHPFYVTKVSDEYCFMRYYLDLWEYNTQMATECCDVFDLAESSKYYSQPTIRFETTRVYELERLMFQE